MSSSEVLKQLQLPKASFIERNFPFSVLEKQLTANEKKQFQKDVESRGMRILATLKEETTNISSYEDEVVRFDEIQLIQIKLNEWTEAAMKRVYHILSSKIPYPLVIRFIKEEQVRWALATQTKVHQQDRLKIKELHLSAEEIEEEQLLSAWNFERAPHYNLKELHTEWTQSLIQLTLSTQHGIEEIEENPEQLLQQLEELDREIAHYVNLAKKESQLNRRIDYQMKATELKQQKQAMQQKQPNF